MDDLKSLLTKELKTSRFLPSYFSIEKHLVYKVVGRDSATFLSNQVTSNSKNLSDFNFQESAITDAKGRLVCSFLLLRKSENEFYLSFDKEYEEAFIKRLNLFLISEDVAFEKIDKVISVGLNTVEDKGYRGTLFGGMNCSLSFEKFDLIEIEPKKLKLLRFTSGKALMGTHLTPGELITNTFLSNYAIDFNKGCYPGQETISKIHNNKGAALFPIVIIGKKELLVGDIRIDGKKLGNVKEVLPMGDYFLHYVLVGREMQVEGKILDIQGDFFKTYSFPLLDNSQSNLVVEIFDSAVESFQFGKDDEAKELLRSAILLDPNYSDAYESLGVILGRERKFEEAIEVMKKLLEVEPTTVMGRTNLSMYYMQLGDKETAEMYKAEATLKQFEHFGIEADKKRAIEEQEKQNKLEKEQRENMFYQVLEIDSEDALANFGLGELELERQNFEKSKKHLELAIASDKKYSVAYLALGKAYLGLDDSSMAQEVFMNGIEIASKNGDLMPANEMQQILNSLK